MKTKDKIVVTFVWGIIVFETTCFLSIMAPLLYQNVQNYLLKNLPAFIMVIPFFLCVVSLLFISYYKSTTAAPGSPSVHIVIDTIIKNTHYSDEIEDLKQKARV